MCYCLVIGTYDKDAELSVNTAIASPLLSRFDIILLMLDSQNPEWDRNVCRYIMDNLEKVDNDVYHIPYHMFTQ